MGIEQIHLILSYFKDWYPTYYMAQSSNSNYPYNYQNVDNHVEHAILVS